jgi:hypothetical protein
MADSTDSEGATARADIRADIPPDSRADTRWLSYDELAELTGAKRESVIRIVRRKGWAKRDANKPGEVRVAVPADVIEDMRARVTARPKRPPDSPPDNTEAVPPDIPPDNAVSAPDKNREISLLEGHVVTLREQLARAEAAADHARRAGELDRAAAAEDRTRAAEERGRLLALVDQLTAELGTLRAAPPVAPPARAAGFFARLLGRGT